MLVTITIKFVEIKDSVTQTAEDKTGTTNEHSKNCASLQTQAHRLTQCQEPIVSVGGKTFPPTHIMGSCQCV